jgi:soluble lytic murein transglycosylase
MLKFEFQKFGALKASVLLLSFMVVLMLGLGAVFAAGSVPLPLRKPEPSFNPIQYVSTYLDFSSAEDNADPIQKLVVKAAAQNVSFSPLSKSDAALYKEAFDAQRHGDIQKADAALKKISDLRLMGHVLAKRYLHPDAYKSSFPELQSWLAHYSDHPDAGRIYRLAVARAPKGYKGEIKKPLKMVELASVREPTMYKEKTYISKKSRTGDQSTRVKNIEKHIMDLIHDDQNGAALKVLEEPATVQLLDNIEYDKLRGEIAAAALYQADTKTAYALATKSVARSGAYVPKAAWVAGLVAWRSGDYASAAKYFEASAKSPYASGWMLASGAYWAARSNMRLGNVKAVSTLLTVGMDNPRTFYGLISTRALGRDFDFNWKLPTFTASYRDILAKIPAGNRAMALVEAGQSDYAQSELLRVSPDTQDQRDALLAYAGYANLPGLGMRIAGALAGPENNYDGALYPFGPWQPEGGFTLDPALLHAIMRQESKFDPEAESPSGARGLMQLMPSTAKRMAGEGELFLDDPEKNLSLGQSYLERLMREPSVNGDLFSLMIAYNAGPGNLAKWKKRWPDVKDPLLFIELIPSGETRAYVERVLANYWIYRMKEDKDVPSLDAITSGQSAKYNQASL